MGVSWVDLGAGKRWKEGACIPLERQDWEWGLVLSPVLPFQAVRGFQRGREHGDVSCG